MTFEFISPPPLKDPVYSGPPRGGGELARSPSGPGTYLGGQRRDGPERTVPHGPQHHDQLPVLQEGYRVTSLSTLMAFKLIL